MSHYRQINKHLPTIRKIPDDLWDEIKLLLPPGLFIVKRCSIISSSDLVGPLKGKHISDLVRDMLNGNVDLWITTTSLSMIAGKVTPAGAA